MVHLVTESIEIFSQVPIWPPFGVHCQPPGSMWPCRWLCPGGRGGVRESGSWASGWQAGDSWGFSQCTAGDLGSLTPRRIWAQVFLGLVVLPNRHDRSLSSISNDPDRRPAKFPGHSLDRQPLKPLEKRRGSHVTLMNTCENLWCNQMHFWRVQRHNYGRIPSLDVHFPVNALGCMVHQADS